MADGDPIPPITAEMLAGLRDQPDTLIQLILRVVAKSEALERRVVELEAKLDQSTPPPPAAPFRRPEHQRKVHRQKPGAKKGHPGHSRRIPESIDEEIEVALPHCPHCQGALDQLHPVTQYVEEILPARPHVSKITTWRGTCAACRCQVNSTHPRQVSHATGAAGVHLGPRAQAIAATLKYDLGLSFSKCTRVLGELFGLSITRGALAQAAHRLREGLQPRYDGLLAELRRSPVVHTDETSWWVDGPGWSLWVFCQDKLTYYRVVKSRSRAQFHEIIPPEYNGVLVSDCLAVYDGATPVQQKCYSHHLKAISAAIAQMGPAYDGSGWLYLVQRLLRKAIELSRERSELEAEDFADRLRGTQIAARTLLEEFQTDPVEEGVRQRLLKQDDHLLCFLEHEGVDATNNLAERQLRPAVIARKVSCGNRTANGARTWECLSSLAVTCRQRAESAIEVFAQALVLTPTAEPGPA